MNDIDMHLELSKAQGGCSRSDLLPPVPDHDTNVRESHSINTYKFKVNDLILTT